MFHILQMRPGYTHLYTELDAIPRLLEGAEKGARCWMQERVKYVL